MSGAEWGATCSCRSYLSRVLLPKCLLVFPAFFQYERRRFPSSELGLLELKGLLGLTQQVRVQHDDDGTQGHPPSR